MEPKEGMTVYESMDRRMLQHNKRMDAVCSCRSVREIWYQRITLVVLLIQLGMWISYGLR